MSDTRIGQLAGAFMSEVQKDYSDGKIDDGALGVNSVLALADYADTGRYFATVLGQAWQASPDLAAVTREVDRRLAARGHQDEMPAPVTPLTEPHQAGFARGFTHAIVLDGDVPPDAVPSDSDRRSDWNNDQWTAYVSGWIEGCEAYATYGGHGIGSHDGIRYDECVHRTL
jgi:hypothetical protein